MDIKKPRIEELDYLKCVMIVLMVMFHLAYFADKHLWCKQLVYTFHMPAFLLISGYMANASKPWRLFRSSMARLVTPYLAMEAGYVVMASLLPIRDHVDNLGPALFLEKLLLRPIGPYWFIHTLILLIAAHYLSLRSARGRVDGLVIMGLLCWCLAMPGVELLSIANAAYFMAGAFLRAIRVDILSVFASRTPLTVIPLILLCLNEGNLDRATLGGVAVTYLVISLLLYVHKLVETPNVMLHIGRKTLMILLFSPIFTLLAKVFIPLFAFDDTAILFMIFSTTFVLAGSLGLARLLEKLGLLRYLLGQWKSS